MRVGVDSGGTFTDAVGPDGRIAKVLAILDRPTGLDPPPAVTWATTRAERAAEVAKTLPDLSRRLVARAKARPSGGEEDGA